jgi:AcrR family transcriptional regulator
MYKGTEAMKPSRPKRTRPRFDVKPEGQYHHGALRQALLDAALVLVERDGPEALTLRAVAKLAGVSPNAPYNHFADKSALLAAVAEEGLLLLCAALTSAQDAAGTPAERLEAIGLAYVRFASTHPARFRLFSAIAIGDKTRHPTLVEAYTRTFGVLLGALHECQRAGVVREGDIRSLSLTAWATVHGLATLLVEDQLEAAGFDPRKVASPDASEAVVRTLFLGLGRSV